MTTKKTYSDITFLFGEHIYNLGLAIERFSMMAHRGNLIREEEAKTKGTEEDDKEYWILEEYELAVNPLDDLKTSLDGIKWVREQIIKNDLATNPNYPKDVHCHRMIAYIEELDARCNELLAESYDLDHANEYMRKEIVKHEDLINASLEKIAFEHEEIYEIDTKTE